MTTKNGSITNETIAHDLEVKTILEALRTFIRQRPGLEQGNYFSPGSPRESFQNSLRAYRAEIRSIGVDKKRAELALAEAFALPSQNLELLKQAFTAFSGRLEWTPAGTHTPGLGTGSATAHGHLSYTTSQYFPTEYRKAAASVLEGYVRAVKRAEAAANPQTRTFTSLDQVRAANADAGGCWFSPDAIRFFRTRFESPLVAGRWFVTSEASGEDRERMYTVREAKPNGGIGTVGKFQGYGSKAEAAAVVRNLREGR
jgi:hypothetical protein